MTDLLYDWPTAARVDTRVAKERFYAHSTVSAGVKDLFVSQVARIVWSHKLSADTINIPAADSVDEIDVFRIDTKDGDVADGVLTAIDKAMPRPVIFEVTRPRAAVGSSNGVIRMTAAHKQLGSGAPKLSAYYSTTWQMTQTVRQPVPSAISLAALYAALLQPLTPLTVRPGEEMSEVADRLAVVRKLEREVAALERKLRTEPQLNRKIELRRTLKTKQHELAELI